MVLFGYGPNVHLLSVTGVIMRCLVMALLGWLTATADQVPSDPGHLFLPMGKIFPSYSSWAVTVTISIIPYQQKTQTLDQTRKELNVLVEVLHRRHLQTSGNRSQDIPIRLYVDQLDSALHQLNMEIDGLFSTFQDMLYPTSDSPRRTKRGLIDGIGNAFSYLFGTATESEIKHLSNNVKLINEKSEAMAHRFNGTLKLLNATRVATTQNRRALRSLTAALSHMATAYHRLNSAVADRHRTVELGLSISEMTTNLLRTTQAIQYLFAELSTISQKFALAQVGILHKSLISRLEFNRLLRNIDKELPTNFALPFPSDEPNSYVRIAKPKLIEGTDKYHILFYIPLVYTRHAFEVFRFFPYQVPMHTHNVSLSYYHAEPHYILMSQDRQHYMQPAQSEIEACILNSQPFCPLHEPAYTTAGSTSCVVALFEHDPVSTRRYCTPHVLPANDAPKAYYLTKGQWLVVLRPPLSITTFCASTQTTQTTIMHRSVDTITLQPECSASGDSFYLPP